VIFSLLANSRARSKGILLVPMFRFAQNISDLKTYQTPFKCIGPILTTCFCFSLLRIPSRRPLVMPATLRSLVPLIIWLSDRTRNVRKLDLRLRTSRRHTFSSGNAGTLDVNLEAQSSLILPKSSRNPRLHARGCNLSRCIHIHLWLTISSLHIHCSHWR
jgi:hypothetical protein